MTWQHSLAHLVPYTKPKRGELRTLADARAYALKRKPDVTDRAWQQRRQPCRWVDMLRRFDERGRQLRRPPLSAVQWGNG